MPEAPAWRFQEVRSVPERPAPASVLLRGGKVFTADDAGTIDNGFVRIENGRIHSVGRTSDLGEDATAEAVVDTTGKTILPGFFNNHAHLGWDGANDLAAQALNDAPEISAYKCAANMLRSLQAGVTTVRDLGMNSTNIFAKQAIEQKVFPGPHILICGRAIVQTAGHTYWCCREASGADEMRRAVREQVRQGADLIKIMGSHDRIEFTDDELAAVIDEAHRNGLPITAHATFDAVIRRVVEFGVDTVEHSGDMSDETIELLLRKNITIITTFSPTLLQAEHGLEWGMPEWLVAQRRKSVQDRSRFEGPVKAAKAGVPIAFGTDAGSPVVPHDAIAPELRFMIELGICADASAALHAITRVSATMNKLLDDRGTLEAGKRADVVILEGDATADIMAVENVAGVYLDGRRVA
jgi:imidazolonepropionase-like amidohydrolase